MSSKISTSTLQPVKSGSYLMQSLGILFIFLVGLLILVTCTETGRRYVDNFKDKMFPIKQKLKDLNVIMFMNPSCPHCIKTLDVLKDENEINNITIIDVSKEEGKNIAEQYGADKLPIPNFISRKTNRSAVGSIKNVSQLTKALYSKQNTSETEENSEDVKDNIPQDNVDVELIKNMNIILFAREGCGWCSKAKEECEKTGISNLIRIIDVSTPEGQKIAEEMLPPETTGVPVWLSVTSKKHIIGYKPVHLLIRELQ